MAADDRDAALLLDMLKHAEEALSYVRGFSYERCTADRMRVRALERTLEIVGEAARLVSREQKSAMPRVPWQVINGQRNVLAHLYGKVDHFQLYRTASEDIPELIATLRKVVG
jgi:uncharacterized protein with HEPN domain